MASPRKLKILSCFDKFKGTMDAKTVGETVLSTLHKLSPSRIDLPSTTPGSYSRVISMSDGGDGFIQSLKEPLGLTIKSKIVTGPLGNKIEALYGVNENTAVLEFASASGLALVPRPLRSPLITTSKGIGELLKVVIEEEGFKKILLGIGGSATNDGGLGAMEALGLEVFTKDPITGSTSRPTTFYGKHLLSLDSITEPTSPLCSGTSLELLCDVTNPLTGPMGATYIFGPQKGGSTQNLDALELGMKKLAQRIDDNEDEVPISTRAGSGAAGGFPASLMRWCESARLRKGIDFMVESLGLEQAIIESDIIFSGEGSYDSQSDDGKVLSRITELCEKHSKPLIILAGKADELKEKEECVFTLASMFPFATCVKEPVQCVEKLIEARWTEFGIDAIE